MRAAILMVIGASMLGAITPAMAQSGMVTAENPASVAAALQEAGFKAEMTRDSTGDPMIRSASGGSKFGVMFYGCTNNARCKSVQFTASWNTDRAPSAEIISEWNRTKRWTKAYLDKDQDPAIDFDVQLRGGGIPQAVMVAAVQAFTESMALFEEKIGW